MSKQVANLSVFIITRNEERNIAECLKSVSFAAEVIVVDTGSTDRTIQIAREHGVRVEKIGWEGSLIPEVDRGGLVPWSDIRSLGARPPAARQRPAPRRFPKAGVRTCPDPRPC